MSCGFLGAPTVTIEKLSSGDEGQYLREEVERLWGKPVAALMCAEIGGSNGMAPLTWAARMGLPVLDADGMGRAFPEVQMVTMELAGISGRAGRGRRRARPSGRHPRGRRRVGRAPGARRRHRLRRHRCER